jgi:hypothetical protein
MAFSQDSAFSGLLLGFLSPSYSFGQFMHFGLWPIPNIGLTHVHIIAYVSLLFPGF